MRLILLALLLVPLCFNGQELRFMRLGLDEGLSQGTVWKIKQDKYGFIWVATDDGLNRFNGYQFNHYKHNSLQVGTISNNSVYDLVEDKTGKIWIATAYGLNQYNPQTNQFTVYLHDSTNRNSIPDNLIRCLAYDSVNNTLWAGTDQGSLMAFHLNHNKIQTFDAPWSVNTKNRTKIKSLLIDKNQNLWIGTSSSGFFKLNINSLIFKPYLSNSGDIERNKLKNAVTCLFQDSKNNIWIGSDGGHVSVLNPETDELIDYGKQIPLANLEQSGRIRSIIEDKNHNIWIATYGGLRRLNKRNNSFDKEFFQKNNEQFSLSSNRLLSLCLDQSGSLWIGNYENGINILHNPEPVFENIRQNTDQKNSLSHNVVLSACEDNNQNLYIGTYGGLNYYNRKTGVVNVFEQPPLKKPILSIYPASNNSFWLGTWGDGLKLFNPKTNTIIGYQKTEQQNSLINNTVVCLYPDPLNDSILWIGTFGGLSRFNVKSGIFKNFTKEIGYNSQVIFCITGLADTLWIGTKDGGMVQFNTKTYKTVQYLYQPNDSNSISSNTVNHINNQGRYIYISTKQGLNVFDKINGAFTVFSENEGLPNNYILSSLNDTLGHLWLSSNNGLCRIKTSELLDKKINPRTFSANDGIQGKEFTQGGYYKSERTGELFFGGVNGLTYFDASKVKDRTHLIPVRLTALKLFDNDVVSDTNILMKSGIKLNYNQNFISFEFVGLDFVEPDKNLYSYKMEGLDKDWSKPSNRRYAAYPDIKPGNYTFRVKAANNQGFWNDQGLKFNIIITPPFWQTPWFIITCSLAIILLVIGLIAYRERQLIQEKKILEETVFERTMELRKKNQDITSSIQYAKRIQEAIILPKINTFSAEFEESFVLFRPKDIVSGDFFWFTKLNQTRIIAVADCTGHGVPGAFMSIIGNNLLEKIVNEKGITKPDEILNQLRIDLMHSLNQGGKGDSKDGMDIAIITHTIGHNYIEFGGAYRPLILIRDGELQKFQSDKISLGGIINNDSKYSFQTIEINPGDCIYLFSDGYPDQFGGPTNKKFLLKRLTDLLQSINHQNLIEQDIILEETLNNWIGNYNQIDDVLLVGIKMG